MRWRASAGVIGVGGGSGARAVAAVAARANIVAIKVFMRRSRAPAARAR